MFGVTLAAPILLTAMVVGLGISLFQSVTSIQEQTLTFVPKALGIVGLLILLMPWMLRIADGIHHRRDPKNAANGAVTHFSDAGSDARSHQLADGVLAGQRHAGGLPRFFRAQIFPSNCGWPWAPCWPR